MPALTSTLGTRLAVGRTLHTLIEALSAPRWRPFLLNAGIVALFGLLTFRHMSIYFPLDGTKIAGPQDVQPYASMNWLVAKMLVERLELPLWNPYVYSGVPFIGDPYVSFFNPFVVLPFIFWGAVNGSKVALLIAVFISGIGQYWLNRILGQGRTIAIVAGVLGLTAGAISAKLASGITFNGALQHAWIAPTLASFILVLRTGRPRHIALAVACYVLLFQAGQLYYWIVVSAVLAVTALVYAIDWRPTASRLPRLNVRALVSAACVGVLSAMVISVQTLPMLELSTLAFKPTDLQIRNTQPPLATLFNFVVPDVKYWVNTKQGAETFGLGTHYAYIGAGVFAFAFFVVPAFWRRPSRAMVAVAISTVLTVAWASMAYTFMADVWRRVSVLQSLRFWGIALAVTTPLIIALLLSGADYVWRRIAVWSSTPAAGGPAVVWRAGTHGGGGSDEVVTEPRSWSVPLVPMVAWTVLLLFLWRIMADPWAVNKGLWTIPGYDNRIEEPLRLLRESDPSAFTIINDGTRVIQSYAMPPQIAYGIQVLNSVWLLRPGPVPTAGAPDGGVLVPAAKYVFTFGGAETPPDSKMFKQTRGGDVFLVPNALPFSFVVAPTLIPYGAAASGSAVQRGVVQAVEARFEGTNRLVVRMPASVPAGMTTLVVMQTRVSGWYVDSPSGTVPSASVGGFLGIENARPGATYVFRYMPASFVRGAWLSVVGVVATVILLVADLAGLRLRLPMPRQLLRRIQPRGGRVASAA